MSGFHNSYPHSDILLNGKTISIKDIINGSTAITGDFETSVCDFVRSWFAGQPTYILQTSGSTGEPKRIIVTREQMIASARLTEKALGLRSSYSALTALDTRYIAGKMMLVRSLVSGMKIVAVNPSAHPLETIGNAGVHFAAFVPYQIQHMIESKTPHLLNQLQVCIIGGAPVSEKLENDLRKFPARCYHTYGMTETISHVALRELAPQTSEVYKGLPGVLLSTDERNCLIIEAPFLSEKVITNDVVELINTNEFRWVGRWDNVINSGGVKISPELLEKAIGNLFTRSGYHQPFFIHHHPDGRLGQRVVLVLHRPAPAISLMEQLREMIVHSFSAYHVPKEVYEAAAFHFTPTDKIDRKKTFESSIRIH